ncbi:MAG: class I SAM-dependent methyltransferase [Acidimicrobiales bacterium]|jgi:predicted O-methyltransferase YrrM
MDIGETRRCNLWNINKLADYLSAERDVLKGYYDEILQDQVFLAELNARVRSVRQEYGFTLGIFAREQIDSVDWFAFERILLYVLVRYLRPAASLETGVFYGGNTAFLLAALKRNGLGRLVSVDLPDSEIRQAGKSDNNPRHPLVGDSELYDQPLQPGFIVPDRLKDRWDLVQGDSLVEIPRRSETFDLYIHDSDHSMAFLLAELALAHERLRSSATIVVDDIDWSNGFFEFCVERRLKPILFTDNGKDDLRVRIGVAKLDHGDNSVPAFTGPSSGSSSRMASEETAQ